MENLIRVQFDDPPAEPEYALRVRLPRSRAARLAILATACFCGGVFAANQLVTFLRHVGVLAG